MNVALFGASGRTGRGVLARLLSEGHAVTAFVPDPAALGDHRQLTVRCGDVRDTAVVRATIRGHDAVVSALDSSSGGLERTTIGTANIVDGLIDTGVQRLLVVATEDDLPVYDLLDDSDLDWTLVCPARVSDNDAIGAYRVAVDYLPDEGETITVGDLAALVVEALTGERYVGKQLGVAS